MFVHELSGCGFEPSCSHLNFRFRACFEQSVPWHSGNYRMWIHSEKRTWHDKNIQSKIAVHRVTSVTFPKATKIGIWNWMESQTILITPAYHCVKSVQIRSFSGRYFPAFGLNTEIRRFPYSVQMWENTDQKKPYLDTFHAVYKIKFVVLFLKSVWRLTIMTSKIIREYHCKKYRNFT